MTSLKDYYYFQSQQHLTTSQKVLRYRDIKKILKDGTLGYPHYSLQDQQKKLSLWHHIAKYNWKYASITMVSILCVWGVWFFNQDSYISYQDLGPVVKISQDPGGQKVYAHQVGTIISTLGEVTIKHQNQMIDASKLYGDDILLLSNQAYVTFMLDGGYLGSVTGPAKIELLHQGENYKINVIEGTIFSIKSQSSSAKSIYITTPDMSIRPQGSVDLTLIKTNNNQTLLQNHSRDQITIAHKQDDLRFDQANKMLVLASQETAEIKYKDQEVDINIIPNHEATILIAALKSSSIQESYQIDKDKDRDDAYAILLSGINDPGYTLSSQISNPNNDVTAPLLLMLNKQQHTQSPGPSSISTRSTHLVPSNNTIHQVTDRSINQVVVQLDRSLEKLNHKSQTLDLQVLSQDILDIHGQDIPALLDYKASNKILALLVSIRQQLDSTTPNIAIINHHLMLIADALLIKIHNIQDLEGLDASISIIAQALQNYTLDPKLEYALKHISKAYTRFENNSGTTLNHKTVASSGTQIDTVSVQENVQIDNNLSLSEQNQTLQDNTVAIGSSGSTQVSLSSGVQDSSLEKF